MCQTWDVDISPYLFGRLSCLSRRSHVRHIFTTLANTPYNHVGMHSSVSKFA